MSPTSKPKATKAKKETRWQGTKTPSEDRMEGGKKPWENPDSVRCPVLLWPMNKQCVIMIQATLRVRSQI